MKSFGSTSLNLDVARDVVQETHQLQNWAEVWEMQKYYSQDYTCDRGK